MTMSIKIEKFSKYVDIRGDLVVFLRNRDLASTSKAFGQIYFVTFNKKNVVRGNHYHKKWHEWFGVVTGKVEVKLINMKTKRERTVILDASDQNYIRLRIKPYVAHAIRSLTNYAALLNYADNEWSSKDTFYHKVL